MSTRNSPEGGPAPNQEAKMKRYGIFLVMALLVLFVGCGSDEVDKDLPVETIRWQLGGDGFLRFYTNDTAHHNMIFMTLATTNTNSPGTYQVEAKRMSGNTGSFYGMIFNAEDFDNFYLVQITSIGTWRLVRYVDDVGTIIKSAEASEHLNTGLDTVNIITVVVTSDDYTVFFNGEKAWASDTAPTVTGDRVGFSASVGIATAESFPNNPVDVRYRQTAVTP